MLGPEDPKLTLFPQIAESSLMQTVGYIGMMNDDCVILQAPPCFVRMQHFCYKTKTTRENADEWK